MLSNQVQGGAGLGPTLNNISFASQNCNSMNVSTGGKNMHLKLTAIMNLKSDIIFLSDIRLGNKGKKIEHVVQSHYKFFYNSTQSKRGVGIMVKIISTSRY